MQKKYSFHIIFTLLVSSFIQARLDFDAAQHVIPFVGKYNSQSKRILDFKRRYELFEDAHLFSSTKVQTKALVGAQRGIPKKIHFVWLGSDLPERFSICIDSWRNFHPDWEIKIWTDQDLLDFNLENEKFLSRIDNFGYKSDIFRYEILYRHGGVYIDCDFMCCRNLDFLHNNLSFYAVLFPQYDTISNAFIGSVPEHPILRFCIDNLEKSLEQYRKQDEPDIIQLVSGPNYFGKMIDKFIFSTDKSNFHPSFNALVILPASYIFPITPSQAKLFWQGKWSIDQIKDLYKEESVAAHLWAQSWVPETNRC